MLRFVARSHAVLERIERNLPTLIAAFPMIEVISVNIQLMHMARLEGEEEIFLTETQSLLEHFNDVPMVIRPKSFFQTNPKVAEQLYATARTCARLRQRKCGSVLWRRWLCAALRRARHCCDGH